MITLPILSSQPVCAGMEAAKGNYLIVSCACHQLLLFLQILDGLCRQTGKFSKNCLALVDEYYQPLYNLLISEIRPKQICESVGLCGENSVFNQQVRIGLLDDLILEDVIMQ